MPQAVLTVSSLNNGKLHKTVLLLSGSQKQGQNKEVYSTQWEGGYTSVNELFYSDFKNVIAYHRNVTFKIILHL